MKGTASLTAIPPEIAREAGLRYVSDRTPGIKRRRRGKTFLYVDQHGKAVCAADTLRRIRSLVIPPAWEHVWICPVENGHIQAVGRDARGRKQYRYHPRWREVRDGNKYERLLTFAETLPAIRQRVTSDLRRKGMPREKVLATVVRLLETSLIRVGNDEYVHANGSYGLTTMHNRHAKVSGDTITFGFRGKSGKKHQIDVHDATLAKLVRRCQELPGQELFGYVDAEGDVRDVSSGDVNAYLREIAGLEFSAKDFRTWAGTVLTATALCEFEAVHSQRQAKRDIAQAVEAVARVLGNTPAVCRKCYIHPEILDLYTSGSTIASLRRRAAQDKGLHADELAVMMLLRDRPRTNHMRKTKPSVRRNSKSHKRL